jgi:hypothetical protein
MNPEFMKDINEKIKWTEERYTEAKATVIKEIGNNDIFTNVNFGAAYATHIDNVTRYASELKLLREIKVMYIYYHKEA